MRENPLIKLESFGQSIWQDYIRRGALNSGDLQHLIAEDGLSGVTSNPSIFEKAISGSHDYEDTIRSLALEGKNPDDIYDDLVIEDIQRAADLLKPVYDKNKGKDGFVSLEVSPHLAYDTKATIAEARRLWDRVQRPNVMIKVPGTLEGLPAIQELISQGININITLLFGLPRYEKVVDAFLRGLEKRVENGQAVENIASVASFFLSRIDVMVDPMLEKSFETPEKSDLAQITHGQVAVSSARLAYRIYKGLFGGERFKKLAAKGAQPQRLLWASTSTKNPEYSDIKYVDALIGPNTVNTLPTETLDNYRDHGNPALRLEEGLAQAEETMDNLQKLGININTVTQKLEEEGAQKFIKSYDLLMDTLKKKRDEALKEPVDQQNMALNGYTKPHREKYSQLTEDKFIDRLWRKDASLWSSNGETQKQILSALGWLHVPEKMEENVAEIMKFVQEVKDAGYKHVVHMGMGGSSLAPLVFNTTFSKQKDGLELAVLDTTDPATIRNIENRFDPDKTLYIVASKSGTTTEPLAFGDYFYNKLKSKIGNEAGAHFVAITDPGTKLTELAKNRGFRKIFVNYSDIGGRFSALSYFGLVPAALYGIDISEILIRALRMKHACVSCVPAQENPGLMLGAALGELGRLGRDKITFLMPQSIASLGMWLEQLLAESTGKDGTGILPVAGERIGRPSVYGQDRLFIYFRLLDDIDNALEKGVGALREAGHPVVNIQLADRMDIGQEFFRWEIATAVAGAILEINPFDQPNVQESKDNTNRILEYFTEKNHLPEETVPLHEGALSLAAEDTEKSIKQTLKKFFSNARPGDYIAILPYLSYQAGIDQVLDNVRLKIRDNLHSVTTLGYGPRYLHSTGQFHKGGPNTGLFILITSDDQQDLEISGKAYSFSVLKRAQAIGDMVSLRKHKRRVVHINIGSDLAAGLSSLNSLIESAVAQ